MLSNCLLFGELLHFLIRPHGRVYTVITWLKGLEQRVPIADEVRESPGNKEQRFTNPKSKRTHRRTTQLFTRAPYRF
ncbi:hypothetical protein ACU8KH_03445 [Lachancea thermotolerans]